MEQKGFDLSDAATIIVYKDGSVRIRKERNLVELRVDEVYMLLHILDGYKDFLYHNAKSQGLLHNG